MRQLPYYSKPNSVSTALLVSSSTKLFPILMVIWDYDIPAAARSLGWAVVANNIEALRILLGCNYVVAAILASVGALMRWAVGRTILSLMGFGDLNQTIRFADDSDSSDTRLWSRISQVGGWLGELASG